MELAPATSIFGKYEFVVRRLHSLLGLVPIGGYLVIHLATNASLLDGAALYQSRVDQINSLGPTTLTIVEWSFIFLPILFHGLVGVAVVLRGRANVYRYPYLGNLRYTLQRLTGVIALVFILYHVFHMHGWFRWDWWQTHVARPLGGARFDPHHAALSAAAAIQASWVIEVVYFVGVAACVYHLANGLWTMGITWGVWTTPHAQGWAHYPCRGFGFLLLFVGLGALWSVASFPLPSASPGPPDGEEMEDWPGWMQVRRKGTGPCFRPGPSRQKRPAAEKWTSPQGRARGQVHVFGQGRVAKSVRRPKNGPVPRGGARGQVHVFGQRRVAKSVRRQKNGPVPRGGARGQVHVFGQGRVAKSVRRPKNGPVPNGGKVEHGQAAGDGDRRRFGRPVGGDEARRAGDRHRHHGADGP